MQLLVDYKTSINQEAFFLPNLVMINQNMAKRYPKRKLSTEDISRALNFDSDSDDSNDKLEKLLGEDSGSDLEFTLNRPALISLLKYLVNRENHVKLQKILRKIV